MLLTGRFVDPSADALLIFTRLSTPLGELVLTASDTALTGVFFPTSRHRPPAAERAGWIDDDGRSHAPELLARARQQLTEYFAGTRMTFDLPLEAAGSEFALLL